VAGHGLEWNLRLSPPPERKIFDFTRKLPGAVTINKPARSWPGSGGRFCPLPHMETTLPKPSFHVLVLGSGSKFQGLFVAGTRPEVSLRNEEHRVLQRTRRTVRTLERSRQQTNPPCDLGMCDLPWSTVSIVASPELFHLKTLHHLTATHSQRGLFGAGSSSPVEIGDGGGTPPSRSSFLSSLKRMVPMAGLVRLHVGKTAVWSAFVLISPSPGGSATVFPGRQGNRIQAKFDHPVYSLLRILIYGYRSEPIPAADDQPKELPGERRAGEALAAQGTRGNITRQRSKLYFLAGTSA